MIQENHASARPADAAHLMSNADRIRHDADEVRRVDDVEGVVGKFEICRIHLQQPDVPDVLALGTLASDLEHRLAEVDARYRTVLRIERKIDAGADSDLEHALARLNVHSLDGAKSPRVKRGAKNDVVDLCKLVVHTGDEIILNRCHRKR